MEILKCNYDLSVIDNNILSMLTKLDNDIIVPLSNEDSFVNPINEAIESIESNLKILNNALNELPTNYEGRDKLRSRIMVLSTFLKYLSFIKGKYQVISGYNPITIASRKIIRIAKAKWMWYDATHEYRAYITEF